MQVIIVAIVILEVADVLMERYGPQKERFNIMKLIIVPNVH